MTLVKTLRQGQLPRRASVALLVALLFGCASRERGPDLSRQQLAGSYGNFYTYIGKLELETNGEYECLVLNGSVDGCLNVRGMGTSKGSWSLEEGRIAFIPVHEPSDLVVSLQGATAVPKDGGLLVAFGNRTQWVQRTEFWPTADE